MSLVLNDIRIASWSEIKSALYDIPVSQHGRFRSDYVYRGAADTAWPLVTSLKRMGGNYVQLERPLLRAFKKYADPGSIPGDSIWVRLAVAQHHGLPTRCLDWTISPQVALHFATADERLFDQDAAIWCIDAVKARELLPEPLRRILEREYAFIFSVEMLESLGTLEEFDKLNEHGDFVLFLEPPSLDARIINQRAVMSILPGATSDLHELLRHHPGLYKRIIIPSELKWEIRDKLDQDNVTERMLFPGLDGLCRWLARYYGPGPLRTSEIPPPESSPWIQE